MAPNKTYNTGWKSNLSNIPDPKYANQHGNLIFNLDTTYRNDFIPKGLTICPAV